MATTTHYIPAPEPVNPEEGFAILDDLAQELLDMSGAEFLRLWDAGEFDGPEGDRREIVRLAMLIPLARQ